MYKTDENCTLQKKVNVKWKRALASFIVYLKNYISETPGNSV